MKISTKGRYGLRALVDLAANGGNAGNIGNTGSTGNAAVSLVNIAQRQKISLNYLEQVFAALRKTGIVKSVKGAQGGYILSKKPESITLSEILTVLEGKFSIVDELDDRRGGDKIRQTLNELVWDRINESVNSFLEEKTLAELVENYRKLNQEEGNMYYI